jgi:hypothetical protein
MLSFMHHFLIESIHYYWDRRYKDEQKLRRDENDRKFKEFFDLAK